MNDISLIKGSLHLVNFEIRNLEQLFVQVLVHNLVRKVFDDIIQENIDIIYFDWCLIRIV